MQTTNAPIYKIPTLDGDVATVEFRELTVGNCWQNSLVPDADIKRRCWADVLVIVDGEQFQLQMTMLDNTETLTFDPTSDFTEADELIDILGPLEHLVAFQQLLADADALIDEMCRERLEQIAAEAA